jgi:hypothetical protein
LFHEHIVNHIQKPELCDDNTLHVIGMVSNPIRFHSRYRLFRKWYEEMKNTPNVKVYIAEIAYGDRQFEVTDPCDPTHLQLRTRQVLWQKENALNLIERELLPLNWRYIAWLDTDIHFCDPHWAQETIHQLQLFHLVQPWSDCMDLGPHGEVLQHFQSFCYLHRRGVPIQCHPSQPYKYAHTGFAGLARVKLWENTRGLMDWCIVGSADHHQAWASIGKASHSVHGKMSEGFKRAAYHWQDNAYAVTGGNVGFCKGRIEHFFHGKKQNRRYRERWQMFIEHQYNPYKDLIRDQQGLVLLRGKPRLRHEVYEYMVARGEDSVDTY